MAFAIDICFIQIYLSQSNPNIVLSKKIVDHVVNDEDLGTSPIRRRGQSYDSVKKKTGTRSTTAREAMTELRSTSGAARFSTDENEQAGSDQFVIQGIISPLAAIGE